MIVKGALGKVKLQRRIIISRTKKDNIRELSKLTVLKLLMLAFAILQMHLL